MVENQLSKEHYKILKEAGIVDFFEGIVKLFDEAAVMKMVDRKLLTPGSLDPKHKSDPRTIMVYWHSDSAKYVIMNCPRDSPNYVRRVHKCINYCKYYRDGLCIFDSEVEQL